MFAVFVTALLCLVSLSHSAPHCDNLVRALDQLDSNRLQGHWALVAGSLKDPAAATDLKGRDSVTVFFHTSSYTQANRVNGMCKYVPYNITLEDQVLRIQVHSFSFTGTFRTTSCPDCVVLNLEIESPGFNSTDLYLLSKRRAVEETEMVEFKAQVECMKMPEPVVMDANQELCPEQMAKAAEEGTDGAEN